jgi:hypothetical protein
MINRDDYILDSIHEDVLRIIEARISRVIPTQLRELLATVGFLQNAIGSNWPESSEEFVRMQDQIPQEYVAFADDGAGNHFIVSIDNHVSLWNHEELTSNDMGMEIKAFISEIIRDPEPLDELSWQVQMAFSSNNEEIIFVTLFDEFGMRVMGEWQFDGTEKSGVSTFHRKVTSGSAHTRLEKLACDTWDVDIISHNLSIPIVDVPRYKNIFAQMRDNPALGFKLVNYGILPSDFDGKEDE